MSKFLKLMGVLMMAMAVSFAFVGCGDDEDDDEGGSGSGGGLQWPTELTPQTSLTGEAKGSWRTTAPGATQVAGDRSISFGASSVSLPGTQWESTIPANLIIGQAFSTNGVRFDLVRVEGKKITVKRVARSSEPGDLTNVEIGQEVVFCTDYTINGNAITFVSDFEISGTKISERTWNLF